MHPTSPGRRRRSRGVAPVSLDDLARRTAELWTIEPHVPPRRRTELLGELHALEGELDTLLVRSAGGTDASAAAVRRCAQRYVWLREQWGDHGVAA